MSWPFVNCTIDQPGHSRAARKYVRSHARKHAQGSEQCGQTRALGKRLPTELPKYVHRFRTTKRTSLLEVKPRQLNGISGEGWRKSVFGTKDGSSGHKEFSQEKTFSPVITLFSRYFDPFRCLPVDVDQETDALLYLCEFYPHLNRSDFLNWLLCIPTI